MSYEPARPQMPIISFKKKPVEDRTQSIELGHTVFVDVDFITIIPHGSGGKTSVDYVYSEWVVRIENEARQGDEYNPSRFPREWLTKVKTAYAEWSGGQDITVDGVALKNWPTLTPAEFENCKAMHIQTVEQLAASNDDTVMGLGMGGRNLVERAKNYVKAMGDPNVVFASRLTALEQAKLEADEMVKSLSEELKAANLQLAAQAKAAEPSKQLAKA